ncbi:MAG: hypothetical protein ABMA64_32950 [Myxococcota bacterium]
MESSAYVGSGRFRADIERVTGQPLTPRSGRTEAPSLDGFPSELRAELLAYHELVEGWSVPKLCVLSAGDLCSVPDLYGDEREEVSRTWFPRDEAATDFVMAAVDLVNGSGFYVIVHPDGRMGLLCEDPHSFDPLACTLPEFLAALVAAHGAACSRGLDAAKAELMRVVDDRTARMLLTFAQRLTPGAE